MTRAIIFDMDGVLCDSEPFIRQAAVEMFATNYAKKVLPHDFIPFTGMGEDRFLGGVAEKYGLTLNLAVDKITTYNRYLQLIRGALAPLNGVGEFITACRERGLALAVASSADQMKVAGNLRELQLAEHIFDVIIDGSMTKRKKPAPDIFLLAAQELGIEPSHCVVFEDAIAGIQAACAAGMRAVGVATSIPDRELRAAGAFTTVPDLAAALNLLDNTI